MMDADIVRDVVMDGQTYFIRLFHRPTKQSVEMQTVLPREPKQEMETRRRVRQEAWAALARKVG